MCVCMLLSLCVCVCESMHVCVCLGMHAPQRAVVPLAKVCMCAYT